MSTTGDFSIGSRSGPLDAVQAPQSAVSWAAIIAGAFVSISSALVLLAFGAGIGLASVSPWAGSGVSSTTFTVWAAVWLIVVQWLSAALGAYVAGRLRTRWVGLHTEEVTFRDTGHGLITWSVAVVLGAAVLGSAASSLIGGAASATASTTAAAGQNASDPTGYFVDTLFRSDRPSPNAPAADVRPEATRILAVSVKNGSVSPADKTYLAQLISARTGISQPDAEKRIDQVEGEARAAADAARKSAAKISIYIALSMLIGAFIAAVSGALGGRARDSY